jgi:hypothetical protein
MYIADDALQVSLNSFFCKYVVADAHMLVFGTPVQVGGQALCHLQIWPLKEAGWVSSHVPALL